MSKKRSNTTKSATSKPQIQKQNTSYIGIGIILLITFLLYIKVFRLDFIMNWDDFPYLFENNFVTNLTFSKAIDLFNPNTIVCANYHPLTIILWGLYYKFFGLNAAAFHGLNLFFHLFNVVLVYWLIKLLFKEIVIAFITTLIFAIHPMHVESVAWVSEFKDVLYTFFFLAALITYQKFLLKKKRLFYLVAVLLFLLSAFSKPAAICFPVLIFLFDFLQNRKDWKIMFFEKIPFFIIAIFVAWSTVNAQESFGAINSTTRFNFLDRIFLATYALLFYIYKLIVPINFSAMHYYPIKENGFLPILYYISPVLLLIPIAIIWFFKRYFKVLLFGFLFFFITIALVIQFVPVGAAIVAERYSYVPYIGLSLIIGYFYQQVKLINVVKGKIYVSILSIFIILIAYQTWNRIDVWKNGETLFTDVTLKYPKVSDGFSQLAHAKLLNNDFEGVLLYANAAIQLSDKNANAFYHRGTAYLNMLKYDFAIPDFDKAINLNPYNKESLNNRGLAKKAIGDFDGALNDFSRLIEINPNNPDAYINRGTVKNALNDFNGAIDDYNIAINLNSTIPEAYNNRGLTKTNIKDYKGALEDFNFIMKLKPNYSTAYFNRGNVNFYLGNYEAALKDYSKDVELDSKHIEGYINRGHVNKILKNISAACNDWKIAANAGHAHAANLYNLNCK